MSRGPHSSVAIPLMSGRTISTFWKHIAKGADDECWQWTGDGVRGYGRIRICGVKILATRVSYFLSTGVDPVGMCVLHKCDNPSCCNPSHLFLGTHNDNMDDMLAKGRNSPSFGEDNGSSKLTTQDVASIKREYVPRVVTLKSLALKHSVSIAAIHCIVAGRRWAHVR